MSQWRLTCRGVVSVLDFCGRVSIVQWIFAAFGDWHVTALAVVFRGLAMVIGMALCRLCGRAVDFCGVW